ncbi:hypothetical protein Droror1_Dr00021910 [Drosera rotundifolia]
MAMEIDQAHTDYSNGIEEEEYVLLDLNGVCGFFDLVPDTPYVLSGLDTVNPILTIGGKLKLIGEYEETIGTCLAFSETEKEAVAHEETGPSEANLFKGACIVDPNRAPAKEVKPIAALHKILKFRLLTEAESQELNSQIELPIETQPEPDTQGHQETVETPGRSQPTEQQHVLDDRLIVLGLSQERQNFRRRYKL